MSTFKALNIEYDEESDVEVDDTKEIQIEEALKLYQNAIRLHAEGRSSFEEAAKAYQELFASDIFRYPESQNELERIELYGPVDYDNLWDEHQDNHAVVATGLDSGPSSLPQILHLSHKNYAQFKLEVLAARLDDLHASLKHILSDAAQALQHFVSALDKDDSDLDLWKKTAQVGEVLDIKRIMRFCLEAVIDGDEENLWSVLSLPGIDDGVVAQQLKDLVIELEDDITLLQLRTPRRRRKVLSQFLSQRVDSLDELITKVHLSRQTTIGPDLKPPRPHHLDGPRTWTELGDSLLRQKLEKHTTLAPTLPQIVFDIPDEKMSDSPSSANLIQLVTSFVMPDTIATQFPGLDGGKPMLQPVSPEESPTLARRTSTTTEPETGTIVLPSRKRGGDIAGLNDNNEEGRSKSKRLRARESIPDAGEARHALHDANIQWEFEQHLNEVQGADDWLYETAGSLFNKLGITTFDGIKLVRAEVDNSTASAQSFEPFKAPRTNFRLAQDELFRFLSTYSDRAAQKLFSTEPAFVSAGKTGQHTDSNEPRSQSIQPQERMKLSDQGLAPFLQHINHNTFTLDRVAVAFIDAMAYPASSPESAAHESSYMIHAWPEQLKTTVVRVLVNFDDAIFDRASTALNDYRTRSQDETLDHEPDDLESFRHLLAYLQNIFELHLDIYCLIKKADSGVDGQTVALQSDRVQRWFELTREANYTWSIDPQYTEDVSLEARNLWATVFYLAALDDASQDRILIYMQDLHERITAWNVSIELINNAVIPEVSTSRLELEMSKLTTKDFFERLSDMEQSDPVALIETIEPLLDALIARTHEPMDDIELDQGSATSSELITFLEGRSFSEVLRLWNRLLDAYIKVDYKQMMVRTRFRMVRLVLEQVNDDKLLSVSESERWAMLSGAIKMINDFTAKNLKIMIKEQDALGCLDTTDLKMALTAFGEVLRLMQTFNVFQDPIRIGRNQPPQTSHGSNCPSWRTFMKTMHEMQARIWMTVYYLLKDAMAQSAELFSTPKEDQFDLLRALHRNLGIRGACGVLNNVLIVMLRDEFFMMQDVDGFDSEQAQVLYDLYMMNCFINPSYELMDHHCDHITSFDRPVAISSVDLMLSQASKLSMKELVKHNLKEAIEKVHGHLARKKPTDAIIKNREVIRTFLRSPINPVDIYRAMKGLGNDLPVASIPEDDSVLAAKGWYFLMGHLSLTKFRTQKRTGPTPTEDVDIAIAFFMQELEYTTTRWETWFRLAQAYDTKIEESVAWSAERLNNSMPEVVTLQKAAVHCYIVATALAYRSADIAFETSEKMTELYTDFAIRMYSSSRAPFDMLPFAADTTEKFLSRSSGMHKGIAVQPLRLYTAWKIAKVLFQRAINGNSKQWFLHYMLSKCLWKMHSASDDVLGRDSRPSAQNVLYCIYTAIELVPGKKDTSKREPILEPHYKLVSIVNKLVLRRELDLPQAREALDHTHYARLQDFPAELDGWRHFVFSTIKHLRAADKSNWHHRMIARAARMIFEDDTEPDILVRAANAKSELCQQMVTRTMVLQVWRPEAERPGRHFVYTARYTRFFVGMLELLKDRANLDQLARRVRKKLFDLQDHMAVWQDIIASYLRLLRERSATPENLENNTFGTISHEDFIPRKEALEKWMQTTDDGVSIVLDVLREVQEVKKINHNLMKTGALDDLIGDAYAQLFVTVGRQVYNEQQRQELERPKTPEPANLPTPEKLPSNPMHITSILSLEAASTPAASTKPPTPEPELAPAKRRLGIGRREIRTAAEACVHKSIVPSAALKLGARVNAITKAERMSLSAEAPVESAPGSVVDDADDESDLSDIDDEASVDENLAAASAARANDHETIDEDDTGSVDDKVEDGDDTMAATAQADRQ